MVLNSRYSLTVAGSGGICKPVKATPQLMPQELKVKTIIQRTQAHRIQPWAKAAIQGWEKTSLGGRLGVKADFLLAPCHGLRKPPWCKDVEVGACPPGHPLERAFFPSKACRSACSKHVSRITEHTVMPRFYKIISSPIRRGVQRTEDQFRMVRCALPLHSC